jgi:hypothetical protein
MFLISNNGVYRGEKNNCFFLAMQHALSIVNITVDPELMSAFLEKKRSLFGFGKPIDTNKCDADGAFRIYALFHSIASIFNVIISILDGQNHYSMIFGDLDEHRINRHGKTCPTIYLYMSNCHFQAMMPLEMSTTDSAEPTKRTRKTGDARRTRETGEVEQKRTTEQQNEQRARRYIDQLLFRGTSIV